MWFLPRFSLLRAIVIFALPIFVSGPARAQTATQFPSDWANALGSLADKIAAVTKRGERLSLEVKNLSSLNAADVNGLRDVLITDLLARNRRIMAGSPVNATLQVTFSESVEGYVWIARIPGGDEENVVMVGISASRQKVEARDPPLTLHRKLIWQQGARILDFQILAAGPAGEPSTLIVLDADNLSFYEYQTNGWKLARAVRVGNPRLSQRDVRGGIQLQGDQLVLPGARCTGDFQRSETVTCTSDTSPAAAARIANEPVVMHGHNVENDTVLQAVCGVDSLVLVTGDGDWTESDFIQAYDGKDLEVAASEQIQFAGPVLTLSRNNDGQSARVVSLNLKTGAYEASIVSVSCGD